MGGDVEPDAGVEDSHVLDYHAHVGVGEEDLACRSGVGMNTKIIKYQYVRNYFLWTRYDV